MRVRGNERAFLFRSKQGNVKDDQLLNFNIFNFSQVGAQVPD